MKQTNFKSIVHRALSTVNRNSALCIVNRAPIIALLFVLMLGVGEVWGTEKTAKWTASSGALGTGIGIGTITDDQNNKWNYERTLKSGASNTGWSNNCIQLGKNGGVENLTISTSAITGTIKSVMVECSSYNAKHKVSITVGSTSYLSSTATASWTTVSSLGKSSGGTASGTITISFTDGTRALYIKSVTVVYEVQDCSNSITITKGSEDNTKGTFELDQSGDVCIDEGKATVVVTPSPNTANHYVVDQVSTSASGSVTGPDANGKYTISEISKNTTINVSFKLADNAAITLSEAGTEVAGPTDKYPGDKYTLPTAVTHACGTKTFVGWSTVEITTPGDKPTSNFYEPGAEVTLAATNKFYAVYANGVVGSASKSPSVSSFSAISGILDTNISYAAWKGNAGTAPAVNSSQIRVYQNGGIFAVKAKNGAKITKVVLGSAMATSVTYSVDGGDDSESQSISANDSTSTGPILCTDSVKFTCNGTSSSSRLYVNYLKVYYTINGTTYSDYTTSCTAPSKTSISYNKNTTAAVTGNIPATVEQTNGEAYTVSTSTLSRTGYNFVGWNTDKDASTAISSIAGSDITGTPITLYAIWSANSYDVIFNGNGATSGEMSAQSIHFDASANLTANAFARTGYTFSGWAESAQGEKKYDDQASYTMTTEGAELFAVWTAKQYNITYKDQGGADFSGTHGANCPTKHTYGTATNLVSPTKTHYTFKGWFGNSECSGDALTSIPAEGYTADFTLYAKWTEAAKVTVTFKNNGTDVSSKFVYVGEAIGDLPTQVLSPCDDESNIFIGWSAAVIKEKTDEKPTLISAATTIDEQVDKVYNAVWAKGKAVTFAAADASTYDISSNTFTDKTTGTTLAIATGQRYTGGTPYTFTITKGSKVTISSSSNIQSLSLEVSGTNYKITSSSKGTLTSDNTTQTVSGVNAASVDLNATDNQARITTLTATIAGGGYLTKCCDSWNMPEVSLASSTINVKGTTTISVGQGTAYGAVSFSSSDETVATIEGNTITGVKPGTSIISVSWAGEGDFCAQSKEVGTITVNGDVTVTFAKNASDATGEMADQKIPYNQATALNACGFTRTGYDFAGWATSSGGDVVYTNQQSVTLLDNKNLFAKWTIHQHNVAFTNVYDGGTVTVNSSSTSPYVANYNEAITIVTTDNAHYTLATLTYQVAGSQDKIDIKSAKTFNMPDADVTIAATWTQDPTYKVVFYNNGSTDGLTPTTGLYSGDAYGTLPVLEASAACHPTYKAFIGWTTSPISGSQATAPTLAKSTDVIDKADVNLYAVWAQETTTGSAGSYTLNYDPDVKDLTLGYGSSVDVEAEDGSDWVVKAFKPTSSPYGMQINTGKNSSIQIPTCATNITTIEVVGGHSKAVGLSAEDYSGSGTITYIAYGTDATSQTIDLSGKSVKGGYIVPKSGNIAISKIVVNYSAPKSYSNYYTNCSSDPTYTLTVNQPAAGGSIGASQEVAYAETAITLTKNVTAGYNFGEWKFTKTEGGAEVDPDDLTFIDDEFLMPAYNLTVTATFPAKDVESISLDKSETTLEKGASEALPTVNYLPADLIADKKGVDWSTSAEGVAKVENGNIVAIGKGQATITATSKSNNAKTASITVTVYEWVSTGYKMSKEGAVEYTNAQTYSASAWEVSEGFKRSDNESTKEVVVDAANVTVTFGGEAIADGYQFKIADDGKKLVFKVGETTIKEYTITVTPVPEDTFTDNIFSTVVTSQTGTYNLPSIDNQTKGEEATCQDHNIFMGWVIEANKNTPSVDNILKAGTEVTADNTKYFAVWAYDNTQEKDVTASITSFNSTSGTLGKVNWTTGNIDSDSNPNGSNNKDELRLYGPKQKATYGNYIQLQAQTNFTIKSIDFTTSQGSTFGYAKAAKSTSPSYTAGSVSDNHIILTDLNCTYLTIAVKSRIDIKPMSVTYHGSIVEYTDYLAVCAERHEASYDANGATGSYDATNYAEGVKFNLPDGAALTYDDHKFAGWKANNTGDLLSGGAEYTMGENDVKFYAQWNACTAQSLNVNSTGATLYFKEGDTFSSKGLVVTAHRDYCEDDVTVSDWTTDYDGYVFQHTDDGDKTVTVSSESLQAQGTYTIHVSKQCQLVYNVAGEQFAVKAAMTGDKIVFPDEVPADLTASIKFLGWSTKEYTATFTKEENPELVDINTTITEAENVYNAVFGNVRETEDATIVIKKASVLSDGSYSWKNWKQDEVAGKMFVAFQSDDKMYFGYNSGVKSVVTNSIFTPGDIKSISFACASGSSTRSWNIWVSGTEAINAEQIPTSGGIGAQNVVAGQTTTWNIPAGSRYFAMQLQDNGGCQASDITITYEKPIEISKYYMSLSFDYTREVADFSKGTITTICLPKAVEYGEFAGCTVYEVAGLERKEGDPYKIFYDQVFSMEAGVPYVIELNEGAEKAQFHYTGTATTAKTVNGLVGTFEGVTKAEYNDLNGNYIVYQNAIRKCGTNCSLGANKAYIVMDDVTDISLAPAPAPGRRRIAMGANGTEEVTTPTTPTDVEMQNAQCTMQDVRKVIINNQMFIIRNGRIYNAAGALVK